MADYFTFPHNKTYEGNLAAHNSYEAELKNRLRECILSGAADSQLEEAKQFESNRYERTSHLDLKERRLIEPYRQAPSGPYRNFGRRQTSHLRKPHAAGEYSGKSA